MTSPEDLGENEHLPTLVVLHGADDLGWAIAARRQEEGDRYYAQVERVRDILTSVPRDTDERGLLLILDRIADVVGAAQFDSHPPPQPDR